MNNAFFKDKTVVVTGASSGIGWHTARLLSPHPVPLPVRRARPSKLDPFKPLIADLLEQDPRAPGAVILQRLQAAGYFRPVDKEH